MRSSGNDQLQSEARDVRLGSWKEIAGYLKRGERTVRRWEKAEGLPVHRHIHERAASVYAYPIELDAWVQTREAKSDASPAPGAPPPRYLRSRMKILAAVLGVAMAGGVVMAILLPRSLGSRELPVVPLTTYPGDELDPSFSPDGSQVVFSWNGLSQDNFDIYVKTVGEENYVRITRDPGDEFNPVWSPDGRRIAFLRELGERQVAVMLASPVGGAEVMLAKFPYPCIPGLRAGLPVRYLSWHSSSNYVITSVPDDDGPFALRLISLTGEVRSLTAPRVRAGLGDLNPTLAPDGKTLAFTRYLNSGFGGQLYALGLSPNGNAPAAGQPVSWAASSAISAVWVNNGRQLIYQRYGERTLWRTTAFEPNTPRCLALDAAEIQTLAVSHDSRSLVFSSGRVNLDIVRTEISRLDSEPHTERVISSTRLDTEGRLSPDGRRIVFVSERSGAREIWVSGVDGTAARHLTSSSNAINEQPSWSPDGSRIAFASRANGGNARIYVSQTNQPRTYPVTNGSADDSTPRWSRDGRWLYFSSNRTGRTEIWKASTSNLGDQRQVTAHGGDGAIESPDGAYLYYVQRNALPGSQHLRRVKASGGEEESPLESRNINWWDFVPADDGVYFVDGSETDSGRFLYLLELGTRQVRPLVALPKSYYCCPEISSDRRHVFYSVLDSLGYDLMMVHNFE
jgi:Tol biopolymer transport system component